MHTCKANTVPGYSRASVLNLSTQADNGVSIGFNSDMSAQVENGTVALGYAYLKRQLLNVGDALKATDAVNLRSMKFIRVEGMLSSNQPDKRKTRRVGNPYRRL
ncbi:MAG: hypothetical protein HRT35_13230 [Algicola sp.]|nr:hypothetical protein [Algicola sp.]